jgi:hypothetical protein
MNIFLTGGTGFVGSFLTKKLTEKGHKVTILTRKIKKRLAFPKGASFLEGDPRKPGSWQEEVVKNEAIINLAGESIFTLWTKRKKKEILNSRILTTRNIVEALKNRKGKETHLFSASAVGYYGFHGDEELAENDQAGNDFLARIASAWELEALKAKDYGVRVALCRIGMVLGKHGGALAKMVPIFKGYLGAPLGSGKQWISWIHEEDLANIILFILEHKNLEGPVNFTSPNPVRNEELTKVLGEVLQKPTFLPPIPNFTLKILLGELADVFIRGQRVIPKRLLDNGFQFKFSFIKEALKNLLET